MPIFRNKSNKRIFVLLILLVGLTFASFGAINTLIFSNVPSTEDDSNDKITQINDDDALGLADYYRTIENTGSNMNITLHQSIVSEVIPAYEITNFSRLDNRSFEVPAPIDTNFNSSYAEIEVQDIYAPNVTRIIEDNDGGNAHDVNYNPSVMPFKVFSNSYLVNFSTKLFTVSDGTNCDIRAQLYNGTWSNGANEPHQVLKTLVPYGNLQFDAVSDWVSNYSEFFNPEPLDPDNTDNNTFYIELTDQSMAALGWYYRRDDLDIEGDDGDAYEWNTPNWDPIQYGLPLKDVDLTLKVDLAPLNNTPAPEEISMEINGTKVSNGVDNSGIWTNDTALPSSNNQLNFTIDASWWDVQCNITKIQVNYTKTSVYGIANYSVTANDIEVRWNVTMSDEISEFEDFFENYYINFTVPSHWQNVQVWNGTTQKTDNITRSLGNGYNELQIFDAGNGTDWFLLANSTNLIDSIDIYLKGETVSRLNASYLDEVVFNATIGSPIAQDDGTFSLRVYFNGTTLNHTNDIPNFTAGSVINLGKWDLSDNVTDYGPFNVQVRWNNDTAAGFLEKNITIFANTGLILFEPLENNSYYKSPFNDFNITVYYSDTGQGQSINTNTVEFWNNTQNHGQLTPNGTIGYYNLTINPCDYEYGEVIIRINASKQYHINKTIYFKFYKVINTTYDTADSIDRPPVFRDQNVTFAFNYTEEASHNLIEDATWEPIIANGLIGWLNQTKPGQYELHLNTTQITNGGTIIYRFNISADGTETQIIELTITVNLPNTVLEWTKDYTDIQVAVGRNLTLEFNFTEAKEISGGVIKDLYTDNVTVEYKTDSTWEIWDRQDITYFPENGGWKLYRDGKGNFTLNISTGGPFSLVQAVYTLRINISYSSSNPGPYNTSVNILSFTYGTPGGSAAPIAGDDGDGDGGVTGIQLQDIIFWVIILAVIGGAVGAIVGVQRKIIVPKKREKERILREVTTIFDDAINMEHILVIYKGTGTCLFFKSYGMEEIDPELISGFLTAVSSFGREMDSQEALNEIQYGDKMLLLADGEYVRVALVLDKQASLFLRQHLKDFIDAFEIEYGAYLPEWKGQIDVFMNAGELVDVKFHTSIILPHEIIYDLVEVKMLKVSHSKDVLEVAQDLIADSERKFFFIATLLTEAIDKTRKDKAEVFMGIKELREKKLLTPIQISAIEKPTISQQELVIIRQQVSTLGLSEKERNKLVNDLALMSQAEREAYLTSTRERAEIVSAPIKTKVGVEVIDNAKSAKKEVGNLAKQAKSKLKQRDFKGAIEIYRNAAVVAANWDLTKELEELEDTIRITQINGLKEIKKRLENDAKAAVKNKDYATAAEKYNQASKAASEIFKLGITEMNAEVKKLTKKSKEFEKLI